MIGPGLNVRGGVSSVERLIVQSATDTGENITHVSSYEDGGILVKLFAFTRCIVTIPFLLLRQRFDVIHIHFSHYGSTLRKVILLHLLRLSRVPILMHSHGSDFHEFFRKLPGPLRSFVAYSLNKAARVVVLSESWKKFFVSEVGLSPRRVNILHNPVEIIPRPEPVRDGKTRFLFLGRLEKRKGIYDIVDALTLLQDKGQHGTIELVAAGDGDVEAVGTIIEERGLGSTMDLTGWVDRRTVVELLQRSHVLILPSYNEGLPMALLEAMGCGMAVVTSPVGGIPEVVSDRENGILVEPGNLEALVTAIVEVQDPALQQSLGENARQSMAKYSLDAYCRELSLIYHSVEKRAA